MARDERLLRLDDLVDTGIGLEVGLDGVEEDDRSICASSAVEIVSTVLPEEGGRDEMNTRPNWPRAVSSGENATASWKVRRNDS